MLDRKCFVSAGLVIMLSAGIISAAIRVDARNIVLYVSPSGNDSWSGTTDVPSGNDGPLASLNGAKNAARKIRSAGDTVKVLFESGRYEISRPVVFSAEDSGSTNAQIIYQAAPGAKPVISGARRITGFKVRTDGLWEAQIPGVRESRWYFEQLWVNGHRATRARTPNSGYLRMEGLAGTEVDASGQTVDLSQKAFIAGNADVKPLLGLSATELADVQVTTYSAWETARHRIIGINPDSRLVKLGNSAIWQFPMGNIGNPRYQLENYREALDAPGEWFLSRDGILLYKPSKGEKADTAQVYAPVAEDFLVFAGDATAKKFVENISFKGLTFEHSQYLLPPTGHADPQAEVTIDATITVNNARNLLFEDCSILHTGKYAFWFKKGSRDCTVSKCLLEDMGAGGIKIGEFEYTDNDDLLVKHITVDNNIIRGGGKVQTAGIGVIIGHSPDNIVTHNEISDLLYTAVSVGWSWGYGKSNAVNNKIDFNHLHHIGYGVLSDMGAVYTLGISPGTTVSNNLVHDVTSHVYGGWGLYNDEGSTHITLENNLIYNCNTGGYHQHYGEENHFTNNIIAYCGDAQIIRSRREEHISFIFDHNIVIFEGQPVGGNWVDNVKIDNNIYWNTATKDFLFWNMSFDAWKAKGYDVHSLIVDPMFVNPAKNDYRLKSDSPASKIGFKQFDYTRAGVYGSSKWKALAKNYKYEAPYEQKLPPAAKTISEDFEKTQVGAYPVHFGTKLQEGKGDNIVVTDETAASGKHSLKFIDKAGLSQAFYPFIDYRVSREDNRIITCDFDVRVDQGGVFWHEWRDWTLNPYRTGPTLKITNGKLLINDQPSADVPTGTWAHIKVSCGMGNKANGTWDLQLTLPGQQPQMFKAIKMPAPGIKQLTFIGFISNATEDSVLYIDNVKLK